MMNEREDWSYDDAIHEIVQGLRDFKKNVIDFDKWYTTYLDLYPNQWVAFHNGEIIANSSNWGKFWTIMNEKEDKIRKNAYIQYLDPNPPTFIL